MKKFTFLFIFFCFTGFYGQKGPDENAGNTGLTDSYVLDTASLLQENEVMYQAFAENGVKSEAFNELPEVSPGYYIIANVFRNTGYLDANLKELQRIGFNGGSVFYEDKALHYLYLERYDRWEMALKDYISNLNGKYVADKWIMIVQPKSGYMVSQSRKDEIPIEAVTYEMLTSGSTEETSIQSNTSSSVNESILRANDYFNRIRYAEAAELYEEVLAGDMDHHDMEILQKVGDAHYYNTNMERAHFWYQKLYTTYRDGMNADYLFKYAQALTGIKKHRQAKRIMRIYDGKKGTLQNIDYADEALLAELLAKDHFVEIKNLAINSTYSDFGPMFHKGDEIVYSSAKNHSRSNTRRYKLNNQPFLDLYVAKVVDGSQDLKDATLLSQTINTKYHEAAVSFTGDHSTMYFTRNNFDTKLRRDRKESNHLKIYVSRKVDGKWTKARELPFNSDKYSMGHPALSPDGKKLYFISDMPGSMGETDIFVVDVHEDGTYSQPKNLGPTINTVRKEMFPFVTDRNLYFSSNGHVGLGDLDVFEAELDTGGGFKAAVNLGTPINSERDDFSYIVNEMTNQGYFASNRKGGKGDDDLYSFEKQSPGEEISNSKMDTVHTQQEELIEVHYAPMKRLEEVMVLENGIEKLKTEGIYFDFDRSDIRKDASSELDKLVEVLKEYKEMVIKIESHTDSRGDASYNQYLSDKRAKSTRDYMISQGISADRIHSAIGYGEAQLINACKDGVPCSRQAHERNRRSEFIIVNR